MHFVILSTLPTKICQESRPSLLCHSERSEESVRARFGFSEAWILHPQTGSLPTRFFASLRMTTSSLVRLLLLLRLQSTERSEESVSPRSCVRDEILHFVQNDKTQLVCVHELARCTTERSQESRPSRMILGIRILRFAQNDKTQTGRLLLYIQLQDVLLRMTNLYFGG